MSTFSTEAFEQVPIVGIIRGLSMETFPTILEIYQGAGFTTLEVTMNTEGANQMIRYARDHMPNGFNIGAGTVRTTAELEEALASGAQFIVTPIVNVEVIASCKSKDIPVFPGAYTPTEVYQAWEAGATAVKIFPATTGGLAHIKALKGPLDHIPMIPTGGVNSDNLPAFFDVGIYGVGMGSQLFPKSVIANKNWAAFSNVISEVHQAYQNWKRYKL